MEGADVACDVPTVGGVKVLEVLDKRFDEDGRDHDDYDHDGHWSWERRCHWIIKGRPAREGNLLENLGRPNSVVPCNLVIYKEVFYKKLKDKKPASGHICD